MIRSVVAPISQPPLPFLKNRFMPRGTRIPLEPKSLSMASSIKYGYGWLAGLALLSFE